MDVNWPTLAGNLAVGLVVAVVSARVTIHFALKRFYSEKWWERKAEAYGSIIEALHHMKNYADIHIDYAMRNAEVPEDQKTELAANFKRAHAEVRKRADVGTFVISEQAVKALQLLEKGLDESRDANDWYAHLDSEYGAVKKCLVSVREIARRDLGLEK